MECNIGNVDRLVRALIAAVLLIVGLANRFSLGLWQYLLYIIAIILIVTAITRFCLPYKWFGISTCKTEVVKATKKKKR